MFADSHCHLDQVDLSAYSGDLSQLLANAENHGVKHFLNVCTTLKEFPNILDIAKSYPNVHASIGLHPNELDIDKEPTTEELVALGLNNKIVAVGETGLDYFRSEGDLEWQRERFRCHIRAAKTLKKPLIVHTRQAKEDTMRILNEEKASLVGGVMHCFTEDWLTASQALDLNFYISFSGIVTFRNAVEIQEVAKRVPLEKMLIETDSPYLAPNPHRGKPNEPANVRFVAEFIANLRGITVEEVAKYTTENYFKLFNIKRE
jgi:TatD DNase family protein